MKRAIAAGGVPSVILPGGAADQNTFQPLAASRGLSSIARRANAGLVPRRDIGTPFMHNLYRSKWPEPAPTAMTNGVKEREHIAELKNGASVVLRTEGVCPI